MVKVAPSLLSADFSRVQEAVETCRNSGADWIHYDVMDGVFVPPITFGHQFVADARKHADLPADVHLMTVEPWKHFQTFVQAGATAITFHYEAAVHHHRHVQELKGLGVLAGVSVVPSTPVQLLFPLLEFLDLVLVMTVNPGYGGQKFLEFCLEKIELLHQERTRRGLSFLISVDGGINTETAVQVKRRGADILVTGSSFFASSDPADYVARLRQ